MRTPVRACAVASVMAQADRAPPSESPSECGRFLPSFRGEKGGRVRSEAALFKIFSIFVLSLRIVVQKKVHQKAPFSGFTKGLILYLSGIL